jgi:hypothetical protein
MGGTTAARAGCRFRRARRLHRSDRGVVSVVGTLLALLVFFALFGIFLTQYVPLWMTDNESAFSSQAAFAFSQLKSNIDYQYSVGGPTTLGVPFTLTSNGVPLIAQATQATLDFIPSNCAPQSVAGYTQQVPFYTVTVHPAGTVIGQPVAPGQCIFANVTVGYGPGGTGTPSYYHMSTGTLEMLLPNRYYTPETFYYEDDAVIQSQLGGYQVMAFPPPFNVTTYAGNTTVATSFLQLYGNATAVVGQQSQQVFSSNYFSQFVATNGKYVAASKTYLPTNFSFEIGTQYPCAWYAYLNSAMATSGLTARSLYWLNVTGLAPFTAPSTSTCANDAANGATTVVWLQIRPVVDYATLFYAGSTLTVGVGGG